MNCPSFRHIEYKILAQPLRAEKVGQRNRKKANLVDINKGSYSFHENMQLVDFYTNGYQITSLAGLRYF